MSRLSGAVVHLKIESVLPSHAFKIRGAFNAALNLKERHGTATTLVTASAGNHGRAMAIAAERLGLHVVVFTPATAPAVKKAAIRAHGAVLDDSAPDYDATERAAREYAARHDAIYISPYNHPDVIAGAGTIGIEVIEALPDLDVIVIPLGGGGLAGGIGVAIKAVSPRVEVIGVEAEASMPFAASLARGEITAINPRPSLADGLTGNLEPGLDHVRSRQGAYRSARQRQRGRSRSGHSRVGWGRTSDRGGGGRGRDSSRVGAVRCWGAAAGCGPRDWREYRLSEIRRSGRRLAETVSSLPFWYAET